MISESETAKVTFPQAEVFSQANKSRVEELTLLLEALTAFDPKTALREEFTALFQLAIRSLEMNEEELADLLDTTRSTINRWENGRNVPTRSVRKPVFSALAKEAHKKLKRHASPALEVAA